VGPAAAGPEVFPERRHHLQAERRNTAAGTSRAAKKSRNSCKAAVA
jgi:hypothetical protein